MTKQSKGKKSADKLSLIGKVCLLEGSSRSKMYDIFVSIKQKVLYSLLTFFVCKF